MKKNKWAAGLIAALLAVVLLVGVADSTGGKLAQPERTEQAGDAFIGFHLVPERIVQETGPDGETIGHFEERDRTHWVEYGTKNLQLDGFGSVAFPREILIGTYNEETHRYDFPGMEGFNCFVSVQTREDGTTYLNGYTDMADSHLHRKFTDEGEENILTGTLYMDTIVAEREEEYEWILQAYRVYQMADGTVYLDGSGNGYAGGGFTAKERVENVITINGETKTRVTEIEFSIEDAERLERVRVKWFDEENEAIGVEEVDLTQIKSEWELTPPSGTAWALVIEEDEEGGVTRTAVEPDHEGQCSHRIILMGEADVGRAAYLRWTLPT